MSTTTTTSREQVAANRANATHSTGPITPEGKAASSRNAISHGLYSATVAVHYWESKVEFDQLRHGFMARFRPIDCVEAELVNRLVDSTWRRNRIVSMETTLLNLDIEEMSDRVEQDYHETDDGLLRVTLAFRERHGHGVWDAIQRHLTATERSYQRAMRELVLLQGTRFNQNPAEEPQPAASETAKIVEFTQRSQFRTEGAALSCGQPETPETRHHNGPKLQGIDSDEHELYDPAA